PAPQVLRNVRFPRGRPLADANVTRAIEDGRAKLGESGRLIVRPSGTEPVIRVMGEGDNIDLVERVVEDICAALSQAA
ncbi:MAG TPA: phosphoglucosamine mutase, partial [Methylocella sp.]|nr:phosphoglucosamine mutase [Methylocella sp.]